MAVVYADVLARVRLFVMDAGSTIWADADLQGAIRLALQEINLKAGASYTLSGLDAAAATTLPANLEGIFVLGASGYAGQGRAVDRAESYELANETAGLETWSNQVLTAFRSMLASLYPEEQARTADQKAATSSLTGSWADDFGEIGRLDHFDG